MKTRTGKIARLPRALRDQINRRLDDGHMAVKIVAWLNDLTEVQHITDECFAGRPITPQNLSEWKVGGYQEWLARQDYLQEAGDSAANAREVRAASEIPDDDSRLSDHLATLLCARFATLLAGWNGEPSEDFDRRLRALRALTQEITALRREDHRLAHVGLQRQRIKQAEPEPEEPGRRMTPRERENEYRRIFGMAPLPEEPEEEPEIEPSPVAQAFQPAGSRDPQADVRLPVPCSGFPAPAPAIIAGFPVPAPENPKTQSDLIAPIAGNPPAPVTQASQPASSGDLPVTSSGLPNPTQSDLIRPISLDGAPQSTQPGSPIPHSDDPIAPIALHPAFEHACAVFRHLRAFSDFPGRTPSLPQTPTQPAPQTKARMTDEERERE